MSEPTDPRDIFRQSQSEELSLDPTLEALWAHLADHWENEAAHNGFVQTAETTGALGMAAGKYRGIAHDEKYRERAELQLKKITGLALAQLDASRSSPPQTKRIVTITAFAVSMLLIGGCFYAISR